MKCWECKTKMICADTRTATEGRVRRRMYLCTNCGKKTYTIERVVTKDEWDKRKRMDLRGEP